MHQDIASFPSRHFYAGRLLTESVQPRRKDFFLRPYLFFNVQHSNEVQHSPRSFSNEAEAAMVMAIYHRICRDKEALPKIVSANLNIGIIVPYKDQFALLERHRKQAVAQLQGRSDRPRFW
jgi:superfamily I DNA and/or RNA helicase